MLPETALLECERCRQFRSGSARVRARGGALTTMMVQLRMRATSCTSIAASWRRLALRPYLAGSPNCARRASQPGRHWLTRRRLTLVSGVSQWQPSRVRVCGHGLPSHNNVVRPGPSVLHWHWLVGRAWGGGQRACHPPGPGPSTAMVEPASSMSALRRIIDMGVGRRTCRVKVVPSPGAAILPELPSFSPGCFFLVRVVGHAGQNFGSDLLSTFL